MLWKSIASDDPLSTVTGSYRWFAPEGPMTPLDQMRDGWAAGAKPNTDTGANQDNPLEFESGPGSHISEKPSDAPLAAFSLWYAAFVTASISKGLR